ncbi:hypothetical protein LCGC14_1730090 [marine sediment metagenome]|uniref:DUF192 domain-containing protein n=1 Tax=marine sediment metagenome TaxID=412755 RepID=A0A0F9HXL3_9ZZZZ
MPRVINETRGTVVAEDVRVADGIWSRFWGLMGRRSLADSAGLLLRPSSSIHTAFMRLVIDVVFLDRSLRVVKVVPEMKPFRVAVAFGGAHSVLELNAGAAAKAQVETGDQLALIDDE